MKISLARAARRLAPIILVIVVLVAVGTRAAWWPWVERTLAGAKPTPSANHGHGHDHATDHGHDHNHETHGESHSLELSPQALRNIGFTPLRLELKTFTRTLSLPGRVIERPGHSLQQITSPLSGVVTKIHIVEGMAVEPGRPLFEIRLTHEDVVTSQRELLKSLENLDVVNREITRLKGLGEGVIAGKRIVELEYEKQKLEGSLRAERQALILHGLSAKQVETIEKSRMLLGTFTIHAPTHEHSDEHCREDHLFHIQKLLARPGLQVNAGEALASLADHCELYIEGQAFEDDAPRLRAAMQLAWEVEAVRRSNPASTESIAGLKLLYLADRVDAETRAFPFYLRLPNEIVLDRDQGGQRFIHWKFRPGQRLELHVPVERWEKRFVVPLEAIVDEGAETFVFRQESDHFDRVPVYVQHRDQQWAVIANDGSVSVGDVLAAKGAYQLHVALKNKSGGVDPHAGHSHPH